MGSATLTLGLTAAVGLVAAYFALRADLLRRRLPGNAAAMAVTAALASLLAATVYAAFALFSASPWHATALAGLLVFLYFAPRHRIPLLLMLDAAAPAAALGYTLVRLGALPQWNSALAALGLALVLLIFWFLWREGLRASQLQRPTGLVLAEYLILAGGLHWLLDHLQGAGDSAARVVHVLSILAGGGLLAVLLPRFLKQREEHRIIEHAELWGEATQPEYSPPTPECPRPARWKMYDAMSAEVEVLDFLKSLVTTVKPELIVETGTFTALSTLKMAEGLRENGFGRLVTIEYDPRVFAKAQERVAASGLQPWIEMRNASSLETQVEGRIDLLFSDSDLNIREQEVRYFLPRISPHGLILMHDASSHSRTVREAARRLETEGLISVVLLPTPRGLVIAQKKTGLA